MRGNHMRLCGSRLSATTISSILLLFSSYCNPVFYRHVDSAYHRGYAFLTNQDSDVLSCGG